MATPTQEHIALLADHEISSAFSEAYYTLFANIRFNWKSNQAKLHTLVITTPVATAQQAATTANIAIAAAQSGAPTILVEANLQAPVLERYFHSEQADGLRNLLAEETIATRKLEDHLATTFVPGLRLLHAGTRESASSSVLLPAKLQDMIDSMRQYMAAAGAADGIVIINGPPVLQGPDASLLASLVEQTILTIVKGKTTRMQAKQAQEQLNRAHANLVGMIMLER